MHGSRSLGALPDDSVPDAVADKLSNAFSYAFPDSFSHAFAHALPHTLPDEVPSAISNHCTDSFSHTAAANSLCVERVRQMGTVLEDVRRRCAVADKIHRDRTGARRQRMRSFDLPAPVQQFCVYVQPGDVFELWCIQCMHGFVWQSGHQVSDAHFQRSIVHGSKAC